MQLSRTWMFVPGIDHRKMVKARDLGADVLIYDLEDAVSINQKQMAREMVREEISSLTISNFTKYVRINAINTPFFHDDLHEVVVENINGIMLPKAESAQDLIFLNGIISQMEKKRGIPEGSIKIIPLIESAIGLYRAFDIATSVKRINRLAFGSMDFILDIKAQSTKVGTEILYARSQLVVVSRAAEIEAPIDTVYIDIKDTENLKKETNFVKQLGFKGKLVIHPSQIEIVNGLFNPTKAELEEAKLIVTAFEKSTSEGIGAIQVHGKMVDQPIVESAKKILQMAEQIYL
jgi:citrate lyase subunit beta / citryl-CoA lyase